MATTTSQPAKTRIPSGHTPVDYMERADTAQRAVVIWTVHIGERSYYRALDGLIQSFPVLIFYEDTQGRLFDYSRLDRYSQAVRETLLALKSIGEMQNDLARALRLQHQM